MRRARGSAAVAVALGCWLILLGCDAPRVGERAALRRERAQRQARAEESRVRANLREPVLFESDRADLDLRARTLLESIAAILRASQTLRVRLEGHADERGSDAYNRDLGMRRALAARQYLIGLGIDSLRLLPRSYGSEWPVDTASTEEARARNRRVEVRIIRGRTVG